MPDPLRHLFVGWSEIAGRLRSAPAITLFLDFDGTLSPLRPRPEDVRLSGSMRSIVSTLAGKPRVRVWVISGRRRADVHDRTRISGVRYLGLHGWEAGHSISIRKETHQLLECLKERARQIAKSTPAIWVEDKGMVLTIHYARASACDVSRVRQEMTRAILPLNGLFHGIAGERGFELMPAEMGDKGTAVRHELAIAGKAALPVFVGDDAVDEPAFASLMGGITIRVGRPCRTRARFRLSSVQEVRTFLELLNKEIE